jgi:hypothetical protein
MAHFRASIPKPLHTEIYLSLKEKLQTELDLPWPKGSNRSASLGEGIIDFSNVNSIE